MEIKKVPSFAKFKKQCKVAFVSGKVFLRSFIFKKFTFYCHISEHLNFLPDC